MPVSRGILSGGYRPTFHVSSCNGAQGDGTYNRHPKQQLNSEKCLNKQHTAPKLLGGAVLQTQNGTSKGCHEARPPHTRQGNYSGGGGNNAPRSWGRTSPGRSWRSTRWWRCWASRGSRPRCHRLQGRVWQGGEGHTVQGTAQRGVDGAVTHSMTACYQSTPHTDYVFDCLVSCVCDACVRVDAPHRPHSPAPQLLLPSPTSHPPPHTHSSCTPIAATQHGHSHSCSNEAAAGAAQAAAGAAHAVAGAARVAAATATRHQQLQQRGISRCSAGQRTWNGGHGGRDAALHGRPPGCHGLGT